MENGVRQLKAESASAHGTSCLDAPEAAAKLSLAVLTLQQTHAAVLEHGKLKISLQYRYQGSESYDTHTSSPRLLRIRNSLLEFGDLRSETQSLVYPHIEFARSSRSTRYWSSTWWA